jgi:translation initiation factor eIF-2B subunit epsilon
VIIAESFQRKFRPVSHEILKCMFPVANIPNLHYVIEFLIMNKVTEIFVASVVHAKQITALLKAMHYKGVKIVEIRLEDSNSLGDALREIS